MISTHTHRSTPAAELAQHGTLSHVGDDDYKFVIPANPATGAGPVTSWWTAEASDREHLQSLTASTAAESISSN